MKNDYARVVSWYEEYACIGMKSMPVGRVHKYQRDTCTDRMHV